MEEHDTVDPHYQKGFNDGYIFAKYLPELSEQLSKTEAKSSRMEGFQDGRKEYISEKAKEKFPDWLKKDRSAPVRTEPTKDKGLDRE